MAPKAPSSQAKSPSSQTSATSSRSWSLVSVFAPTAIALAGMRWGTQGFAKLDSLLSSPSSSQSQTTITTNTTAPFSMASLRAQYAQGCPDHTFRTSMFSSDPIITYIENYLSPDEIAYLLELATPLYQQSPVSQGKRLKTYNAEIRSSMSAVLGGNDPVVRCIEQRSVDFQGFLPRSHLEDLQVVKYGISDHFRPHFDWFGGDENPRISSFFVYIACDAGEDASAGDGECKGGATQFPDYEGKFPAKWCKFIDCHDDSGVGGVAFKPIPGNAIFWGNLYPNGTGHPGTWHAGMPVQQGRKVGMNILTRRDRLVGA